jgi:hypothetical protein
MKHATAAALEGLSALLDQIRLKDGIKEKKLGIFYKRSKAFLHFHDDPAGLFADVSVGPVSIAIQSIPSRSGRRFWRQSIALWTADHAARLIDGPSPAIWC